MPNTGRKIVTTLKDQDGSGHDLGDTKPNTVTDPDYIAPYIDTTACPVTYTTTCPAFIATGGAGTVVYEANIDNSVVNNPAIDRVVFRMNNGTTDTYTRTFTFPNVPANYFTDSFTSGAGSYTFYADYKLGATNVTTCTLTTITVT